MQPSLRWLESLGRSRTRNIYCRRIPDIARLAVPARGAARTMTVLFLADIPRTEKTGCLEWETYTGLAQLVTLHAKHAPLATGSKTSFKH